MSVLEIVLYSLLGVGFTVYVIVMIVGAKKKKKKKNEEED